jgi:hypothetical protein
LATSRLRVQPGLGHQREHREGKVLL